MTGNDASRDGYVGTPMGRSSEGSLESFQRQRKHGIQNITVVEVSHCLDMNISNDVMHFGLE